MRHFRFLIRLWYWNRNFELARWAKKLEKLATKRRSIILQVPMMRRQEFVRNDPVLATCLQAKKVLDKLFITIGADDEK
jgi:hypothetical protein